MKATVNLSQILQGGLAAPTSKDWDKEWDWMSHEDLP